MLRRLLRILLFAATMLGAGAAFADEQSDLEKARAAYIGRRYDEAEERFRALLDPAKGPWKDRLLYNQARMFWAATLVAKKQFEEAITVLEGLILDDPSFEPDPLVFPGEFSDLYFDTRKRMTDRINAAKQAAARQEAERRAREEAERRRQAEFFEKVKRLASEEKETVHHSRWVAAIPFGVGQFQNDQKALGWVFLGTEAALLAGALAVVPSYVYHRDQAIEQNNRGDRVKAENYNERAADLRYVNLGLIGGFCFVALVGVIQAQMAYVPDVIETKPRPLPQAKVKLTPVGIIGTF
jgi:tetratricopeptide (TPR) repeat protein